MSDISLTEDPIGAFKRWLAEAEKTEPDVPMP